MGEFKFKWVNKNEEINSGKYNDKISPILRKFRFSYFTSLYEGFGLPILEALNLNKSFILKEISMSEIAKITLQLIVLIACLSQALNKKPLIKWIKTFNVFFMETLQNFTNIWINILIVYKKIF